MLRVCWSPALEYGVGGVGAVWCYHLPAGKVGIKLHDLVIQDAAKIVCSLRDGNHDVPACEESPDEDQQDISHNKASTCAWEGEIYGQLGSRNHQLYSSIFLHHPTHHPFICLIRKTSSFSPHHPNTQCFSVPTTLSQFTIPPALWWAWPWIKRSDQLVITDLFTHNNHIALTLNINFLMYTCACVNQVTWL